MIWYILQVLLLQMTVLQTYPNAIGVMIIRPSDSVLLCVTKPATFLSQGLHKRTHNVVSKKGKTLTFIADACIPGEILYIGVYKDHDLTKLKGPRQTFLLSAAQPRSPYL